MSTPWICNTCGTQYAASDAPPAACPVCEDDRQYVDWAGQRWVTHAELQQKYTLQLGDDDGVFGIDMPGFAIPQRAMLLPTDAGNLLMEVLPMVNDEAVGALKARGGVDRIVISHPHFYASMVEWSEALGGVPILLHAADKSWVRRPSARLQFWEGDTLQLSDDVTLINVAGHFPGSTALHWRTGPRGRGALFPGDAPHVGMDRKQVAFMHSVPNFMPMKASAVQRMRALLSRFDYADVHGFSRGRNIIGNGRAVIDASFDRFLRQVAA